MADEKIALEIFIEADKANLSLGELQEGFEAINEELKNTEKGTERFNELSTAMANTSTEVKNLEASFETLDNPQIANELSTVAGGIADVTAAFILMGGENETIEQMASSIQTAMAVSMGLKGAIDALPAVTKAATTATKIFNAVLKANPIMLVVGAIIAAVAAYKLFVQQSSAAAKEQKILNDSLKAVQGTIASTYEEVNKMENAFDLAREGVISKEEALETYNTTIGQTLGQATSLEEAEERFDKNTAAYVEAATLRAQAQELIKLAAQEQTAALLATEQDNRGWADKTIGFWSDAGAAIADYSTLGLLEVSESSKAFNESLKEGATERLINEKEANAASYTELAKSLQKKLALLEEDNGFVTDEEKKAADEKEAAEKKAAAAAAAAREKRKAQREKDAADKKAADEKAAEEAKILAAELIRTLDDLEAKAFKDKNLRALAELELAQTREREALILKHGENAELLAALDAAQLVQTNALDDSIEQEAIDKEAERVAAAKAIKDAAAEEKKQNDLTLAAEKQAQRDKEFANARATIGALSALNKAATDTALLNAAGNEEKKEKIRKASFEREKKLNIAMALINGAQAVLVGFVNGGLPMAIVAGVTAAAQLAAIVATTYQSTGGAVATPTESAVSPDGAGSGGGGAQINPVTNTSTILGNQQVTVTETDITSTQNNVSVIEESATF